MAALGRSRNLPQKTKNTWVYNISGTILGIVILNFFTRKKSEEIQSIPEPTTYSEDVMHTLLYQLNKRTPFIANVSKVIYLGGKTYTSAALDVILNAITEMSLSELLDKRDDDIGDDTIEIFYVEAGTSEHLFVIIYNPMELWENEQLMGVEPVYDSFKHSSIIN